MKVIKFKIPVLGIKILGIVTKHKEKWHKLIPDTMLPLIGVLHDKVDGDLRGCMGFYMAASPKYAIVLFDEGKDLKSTLLHETSHVYRNIIWDMGDEITKANNELCSTLQNYLYDEFLRQMKKHYGFKDKHGKFEPNKRQKKNEIT